MQSKLIAGTFGLWALLSSLNLNGQSLETQRHPPPVGALFLVIYVPFDLEIVHGQSNLLLDIEAGAGVIPSISSDGRVVATARQVAGNPVGRSPRLVVSTYSTTEKRWTEYRELQLLRGPVAISPDGSKLACRCLAAEKEELHVLDLKTGKITRMPIPSVIQGHISWSPDGEHLAFDTEVPSESSLGSIYVLSVRTGEFTKIATGAAPSWSPSGEWIAFYPREREEDMNRVSLIHPDGADSKVVFAYGKDVSLNSFASVWSPDSQSLLIVRFKDEKGNVKLDEIDVSARKITRRLKKAFPIYGWVANPAPSQ